MKKSISILLAGVLALSLTACGAGGKAPSEPETPVVTTSYFGKVSSIVGNELEIDLAKEPEMPEAPSAPVDEGEGVPATLMTPATTTGGAGGAAQRTEVEYTGTLKSFTIPAGIKPKNAQGSEKLISDIKKGSIVNVFQDDRGNITEVFIYD